MPAKIKKVGKLTRIPKLALKVIGVFQGKKPPRFKGADQEGIYYVILKDRMELYENCRFITNHNPFATNVNLYAIPRLKEMSLQDLKSIAKDYIFGLENCNNKTYYLKHIAYRLIAIYEGQENCSEVFKKNWYEFSKKLASEIDDIFGRMYGTGKTRKYKTKLDKRNKKLMAIKKKIEKEEKAATKKKAKVVEEAPKKKKGKKQYDEPKRGRPAAGEPTLSGTIVKGYSSAKGKTREEMMEYLIEKFPNRDPEVMGRSLSVYMSSLFKKKYDITTDSKGRIKFTPKEEEEAEAPKKKKKKVVEEAPKKKKKVVVDDDDDEDEAPKKKAKKKKVVVDDDDDDEEEEAPKKKKVKKVADKPKKKKKKVVVEEDDDDDED